MQGLASILSCRIEELPTTYLGMPLGNKHKALEVWDGILEKAEKKLARWKAQYLSLGGRVTLINSVLDSLPNYIMSLFPIPPKVLKKLHKLRRDFLWKGGRESKGYFLVKWDTVMLSKERGGLGIRNLRVHNKTLLMKWLWRYIKEEGALWKQVIVAKHGELNPWCSEEVSEPYALGTWRTIKSLWSSMERNLILKVGSGNKIRF